ncbi:c-type cytochrome [Paenibacillus lignilyticus]|uniref:Cytochrome c n=1 Tax=Paenibacillus lignilyticus TaxID=1172615 RepID=A0ABS5C8Y7_9BACL|nr:cytochrome c [Paenibacillus lignilyticus]MBP3962462.1 cytochrome c [Paenibacillus lignilyticus]
MRSSTSQNIDFARFFPLLALLIVILLAGCGSSSPTSTSASNVPKVYKSNCISCHGSELQGRMGAATNLQHVGKRMTKEQITAQINKGGGGMPAFSGKLTPDEVQELAGWLSAKK